MATDADLVRRVRERLAIDDPQALADFDELARRVAAHTEDVPPEPLAAPPEEAFSGKLPEDGEL